MASHVWPCPKRLFDPFCHVQNPLKDPDYFSKNEGMLVCIVHGAAVLIWRREKLNPGVLGFLAP